MGLIVEALCALFSIIALCTAMATQPRHAHCPPGWYVDGVRPTGSYTCHRPPIGGEDADPPPPGSIQGRIYCTGGSSPIVNVNTGAAVGCQR